MESPSSPEVVKQFVSKPFTIKEQRYGDYHDLYLLCLI
jgi:hypothetical protein